VLKEIEIAKHKVKYEKDGDVWICLHERAFDGRVCRAHCNSESEMHHHILIYHVNGYNVKTLKL